jgi:D-lactate dehydrogenase (cytochrome)
MNEITSFPVAGADNACATHIAGAERIRAEFPEYLSDESKLTSGPVERLFFPDDESELAAAITEMAEREIKITVAGARTGLVGGCVSPGGALVSLERLDRILDLYHDDRADEWRVRVECGVNLKNLDRMISRKRFPDLKGANDLNRDEAPARFKAYPDSYFFPPDPTETSATLGGAIATNASGARTYRYGPTRDWVRGLRVLLANGEALDIPRGKYFASPAGAFILYDSHGRGAVAHAPDYTFPRTKCAAGLFAAPHMDLVDLFIGSEGTLGVIVAADLALLRSERRIAVAQFVPSDDHAIALAERLRSDIRLKLDSMEFFSQNAIALLRHGQRQDPRSWGAPPLPSETRAALMLEIPYDHEAKPPDLSVLEEVVESCGADPDESWVAHSPRESARLKFFRHKVPETCNQIIAERKQERPSLHKIATDLATPDAHLRDMWELYRSRLDAAGLEWVAFGHVGNSHIHVNLLPHTEADLEAGKELCLSFAQKAVEYGGAISAEHGIGKIKRGLLSIMYSEDQIDRMRRIKEAFDPRWILNPGDIFGVAS